MPSTRRRRRREKPAGKELWQIVHGDSVLAEIPYSAEVALSKAHNLLTRIALECGNPEESIKYTIRLKPLFGPPDDIYHTVLTTGGEILSWPDGAMKTDRAR